MQASGLALMSKALPFTLGQAKRIRLRKHARRTNEAVQEKRKRVTCNFKNCEGGRGFTDDVSDVKLRKCMKKIKEGSEVRTH